MRALALSLLLPSGCAGERPADVPVPVASAGPSAPAASAPASAAPAPSASAPAAPPVNAQAIAACCAAIHARLASTPPHELDRAVRAHQVCKQVKEGTRTLGDLRAALATVSDGPPLACR